MHIKLTVGSPGEWIAVYATDTFKSITYCKTFCDAPWLPVCLFSSHAALWWAVCSFCFWYGLKEISSWTNLINSSYLLSFLSLFFWGGLALISFPFYCLFDDGQAFAKLLFQLPSNRFEKTRLLLNRGKERDSHIRCDAPIWEERETYVMLFVLFFEFSVSLCLCEHAALGLMLSLLQRSLDPIEFVHWDASSDLQRALTFLLCF